MSEMSRRKFLVGAGLATGAIAAAGAGIVKPDAAEAAYTALPWPYATLDLAVVKRRGYDAYFVGGCMYATASALLDTLIENVGSPWDSIPKDMFKYGGGGIAAWGTLCGALNGAAWVIQACAGANVTPVLNDLYQWYTGFAFPSKDHDAYAAYTNQKTTVSNSPLCHASSSKWSYTAKKTINSYERKDRCAKLAGDVAAKTAELLNAVKAGTYATTFVQPNADCSGCHVGAASTYDNVQMKATCTTYCHVGAKNGSSHY